MSKQLAITGIGLDKPGIVASVCNVLSTHQCNIVDTTMARLGNCFSLIVIVEPPSDFTHDAHTALDTELISASKDLGVRLQLVELGERDLSASKANHTPFLITVGGNDQTGITANVARILSEHQLSITDLNAQSIDGEAGKAYVLLIETALPTGFDFVEVQTKLDALSKTMKLDIHCRQMEVETL